MWSVIEVLLMSAVAIVSAWQIQYFIELNKSKKYSIISKIRFLVYMVFLLLSAVAIGEINRRYNIGVEVKWLGVVISIVSFALTWSYARKKRNEYT